MFIYKCLGILVTLLLLGGCGPQADQSSVGRILSNARALADGENSKIANENKLHKYTDSESPIEVYASADPEEARLGWRELNYTWKQIPAFLGTGEQAGPGYGLKLLILKPMTAALIAPEVGHKGMLGGSKGRLILVVREGGGKRKDFTDIFHETVHVCLREMAGAKHLPLWLEEGLAMHWGVALALDYHNFHGTSLRGAGRALTEADRAGLVSALAFGDYPESAEGQAAFYRASRWLAAAWLGQSDRAVAERIGDLTEEALKAMDPADVEKLINQALTLSQASVPNTVDSLGSPTP